MTITVRRRRDLPLAQTISFPQAEWISDGTATDKFPIHKLMTVVTTTVRTDVKRMA